MKKLIVISDPFPRTLDLIFTKSKLRELKSKYKILTAPKNNKKIFYVKENKSILSFAIFGIYKNNVIYWSSII